MLDSLFLYAISIPIYIILLVIYLIKKAPFSTIVLHTLFYFYLIAVIGVTLFPFPLEDFFMHKEGLYDYSQNNFAPFASIIETLSYGSNENIRKQLGGNILLGMPLGFLIPLLLKEQKVFWKVFLIGICFSLCIEMTQLLLSIHLGYIYRLFDFDDLILNSLGCAFGYLIFKIFRPAFKYVSK